MNTSYYIRITVVLFIIGVMMAVLYNTVQQPVERDTRDVWEIRGELAQEKRRHSDLLKEIRTLNEVMNRYESIAQSSPEIALQETIERLEENVGLTPYKGPGIQLILKPSPEAMALGTTLKPVPPALLMQLVNASYEFKATAIAIDNQRLIQTSAIRDINGKTAVNGKPISMPPLAIQVGAVNMEEAKKLKAQLEASTLIDSFYLDDVILEISEPQEEIVISKYVDKVRVDYLQQLDEGD